MKGNKLADKTRVDLKYLQSQIAEAALEIQKNFGLGFSTSDYCRALAHELKIRNIGFEQDKQIPISYKGEVAGKYRVDFIVDKKIMLTIITADEIGVAHLAKQRNFLKTLGFKLGMMINFADEKVEIKSVYR
jgi:GxxExxY protein